MGELADRIRKDADRANPLDGYKLRVIADDIAKLELRLEDAEHQLRETQLAYMRLRGEHGDRVLDAASSLQQRAIDAEQRAAAAWAAVTRFIQTPVPPERARFDHISMLIDDVSVSWHTDDLGLRVEKRGDRAFEGFVALFELEASAPANPDLLERASVEFAEAYQQAKAEEQRQAEEKAAQRGKVVVMPPQLASRACDHCGQRHVLGEFAHPMSVRTRVDAADASAFVPAGTVGIVREWSQYNSPLWVRVAFEAGDEHEPCRLSYPPCQLELAANPSPPPADGGG